MLKERLSYSLAKNLISKPIARVAYDILNPTSTSNAGHNGNRLEQVLRSGSTEELMVWTDTKTRGIKFEKWAKEKDYPLELCCTENEYHEACSFLKSMASQGICSLVRGMDYQEHIEGDGWHGYLDFSNSEIIYDLKVTSKAGTPDDWAKTVLNMHYDIQAYLYTLDGRELRWIVVDDSAPFPAFIGEPHYDFIESGRQKFEKARKLFPILNDYKGLEKAKQVLINPPPWLKLSNDIGE